MTKLQKALYYAAQMISYISIYIWGAQGEKVNVLTAKTICKMETSADNAARVIRFIYKNLARMSGKARAFDCSGFVICCLVYAGVLPAGYDNTANGLMHEKRFKSLDISQRQAGDLIFKVEDGTAVHVGIWTGEKVAEAAGRDKGVIYSDINNSWTACRRPNYT